MGIQLQLVEITYCVNRGNIEEWDGFELLAAGFVSEMGLGHITKCT
jgi:hypothetical protein